jgi:hypothetical protein
MSDLIPAPFWDLLQKYPLITIETEFCLLILLLLLGFKGLSVWSLGFRNWFRTTARHRGRAVLIVAGFALLAHLAALPVLRAPIPGLHDEFSYLLAADTFAQGRLTNPTHPFWIHFESFHIEQMPSYASMYPPAQGMAMAMGIVLLGNPIVGVWITTILFCASLCWMLQGWVPPKWAFIGGLLAVLRFGIFSYWANTYWGGSIAALGGCLLWGGFGRIRRSPNPVSAMLMGLGFILVANSRPYEGFWVSLPVAAGVVWMVVTRKQPMRPLLLKTIAPLGLVLAIGGAAMAYYNWRVYGNPLTLPYTVNRQQYGSAGSFLWQGIEPLKHYNHAIMSEFYNKIETSGFQSLRTIPNYLLLTNLKLVTVWLFYIGPALTLPMIAVAIALVRRKLILRWPMVGLAALAVGMAILAWPTNPHYYSPATGCLYAVLLEGCRRIYVFRRRMILPGKQIVTASVLACVAILAVRASAKSVDVPQVNNISPVPWYASETYPLEPRAHLIDALKRRGGKHLVFVAYSPAHSPFQEYVYNDADIDNSDIVFARELADPKKNLELMKYFHERFMWLYQPDSYPPFRVYPAGRLGIDPEKAATLTP